MEGHPIFDQYEIEIRLIFRQLLNSFSILQSSILISTKPQYHRFSQFCSEILILIKNNNIQYLCDNRLKKQCNFGHLY